MRSGVIAKKLGMTRLFLEDGKQVPVTVLQLDNLQVVAQRTADKDGYTAVQLGAGAAKAKRTTRRCAAISPRPMSSPSARSRNSASPGQPDRRGRRNHRGSLPRRSVRGYRGHLDRQGLCRCDEAAQLRRSAGQHGVSVSHRSHGSTGQCQDPGKVFKGKKMAGHMGAVRVTTQNLQVVRTDADRGLIMVKGAVPGSKGGWVTIKDAVKKAAPAGLPMPAAIRQQPLRLRLLKCPPKGVKHET
jgi:large subunit ribosomal protein L3